MNTKIERRYRSSWHHISSPILATTIILLCFVYFVRKCEYYYWCLFVIKKSCILFRNWKFF